MKKKGVQKEWLETSDATTALKTDLLTPEEETFQPPGLVNEPDVEYGEKLPPDHLNPEQLDRLRESLRQLDAGLGIPHEEVMKEMRSWFKK